MSTNKNVTVTLRELMLDDELASYIHSKHLTNLYNSKKKNLGMIGIKVPDSSDKRHKSEIKYYKALIEKQQFLCEHIYNS
jgi:hypothetical protein